jgi:hypothetical protein
MADSRFSGTAPELMARVHASIALLLLPPVMQSCSSLAKAWDAHAIEAINMAGIKIDNARRLVLQKYILSPSLQPGLPDELQAGVNFCTPSSF